MVVYFSMGSGGTKDDDGQHNRAAIVESTTVLVFNLPSWLGCRAETLNHASLTRPVIRNQAARDLGGSDEDE